MEMREAIAEILRGLPEDRVREVLDFARFVAQAKDEEDWRAAGRGQFSRAYGEDEPEYTEQDVRVGDGQ